MCVIHDRLQRPEHDVRDTLRGGSLRVMVFTPSTHPTNFSTIVGFDILSQIFFGRITVRRRSTFLIGWLGRIRSSLLTIFHIEAGTYFLLQLASCAILILSLLITCSCIVPLLAFCGAILVDSVIYLILLGPYIIFGVHGG